MNTTHVQMRNADNNGNNTTPMRDMTTGLPTRMHIEYESFQIMRGSSSRSLVFAAPTKTTTATSGAQGSTNEKVGTTEEDHEDEYKGEQEHIHDEAVVLGTTAAHPVRHNNYDKYHSIVDEEDTIVAMREQINSHSRNINAIINGDAPAVPALPHQTIITKTIKGTTACTPSTTASTATTRLFCGGLGITEDENANGHGNDPNRSTSGVGRDVDGRPQQQNGNEVIDDDDGLIQEAMSISVLRSYSRITKAIQRTLYACLAPNPTSAVSINEDDKDEAYIPSEIMIFTTADPPGGSSPTTTQTTTPQTSTTSFSLSLSPRSTPPLLRAISSMSESIADSYTLEGEHEGASAGEGDANGGTGDDDYFETRILANFIQSLEN